MGITSIGVCITTTDRGVTLVLVVRPRDTLCVAKKAILGTTNGPCQREQVAVNGNGIGAKEAGEIHAHAIGFSKTSDRLHESLNTAPVKIPVVCRSVESRARSSDLVWQG